MDSNSSDWYSHITPVQKSGNHWNGTDRQEATSDGIFGVSERTGKQFVSSASIVLASPSRVQEDLTKVLCAAKGAPQCFRAVASGSISAKMRDQIKAHVESVGIPQCDVWSGMEFEEFLRHKAEALLQRFVGGEAFPDAARELTLFAQENGKLSDAEILAAMAQLFDRPAFYTPIHQESNLADFKQAITDTIQALGTGIWKARDGHVIGRISSRHQLADAGLRCKIQAVEQALARLRAEFDDQLKTGVIRHCGCTDPDCPTYFMPSHVAHDLERLRNQVLHEFRDAYPSFHGRSAW